jgi:hypothetical protein
LVDDYRGLYLPNILGVISDEAFPMGISPKSKNPIVFFWRGDG